MNILNLTPHSVVVLRDDTNGSVIGFTGVGPVAKEGRFALVAEYKPNGKVARANQKDELVGELEINGVSVPLITTVFGDPTDLSAPEDGTMYVVSVITAQGRQGLGSDDAGHAHHE